MYDWLVFTRFFDPEVGEHYYIQTIRVNAKTKDEAEAQANDYLTTHGFEDRVAWAIRVDKPDHWLAGRKVEEDNG